jgi:hypothetical protein
MNKKVVFIIFMVSAFFLSDLQAQFERTAGKIVADRQAGGIIETWNLEKSNVLEGSFFFHDDWYIGDVRLNDGRSLEKVPLKYNLRDDLLLIMDENQDTRVINGAKIAEFEWFNFGEKNNNRYINCKSYYRNGTQLAGMAELLVEGKADLLIHPVLEIQKGMYSVIHDAGQKNDEYVISENRYINVNDEMYLVKNKKSIEEIFAENEAEIEKFIKANHFKVKNLDHLSEIVRYYNSLHGD